MLKKAVGFTLSFLMMAISLPFTPQTEISLFLAPDSSVVKTRQEILDEYSFLEAQLLALRKEVHDFNNARFNLLIPEMVYITVPNLPAEVQDILIKMLDLFERRTVYITAPYFPEEVRDILIKMLDEKAGMKRDRLKKDLIDNFIDQIPSRIVLIQDEKIGLNEVIQTAKYLKAKLLAIQWETIESEVRSRAEEGKKLAANLMEIVPHLDLDEESRRGITARIPLFENACTRAAEGIVSLVEKIKAAQAAIRDHGAWRIDSYEFTNASKLAEEKQAVLPEKEDAGSWKNVDLSTIPLRAIVVDDEERIRSANQMFLNSFGIQNCKTASSRKEGMALFDELVSSTPAEIPILVLTDNRMPRENDGVNLGLEIRRKAARLKGRAVGIILITGDISRGKKIPYLFQMVADVVLAKPCLGSDLKKAIVSILRESGVLDQNFVLPLVETAI